MLSWFEAATPLLFLSLELFNIQIRSQMLLTASWFCSNKFLAWVPAGSTLLPLLSLSSLFFLSFFFLCCPGLAFDNLLLLLKARSPLETSMSCLSGRISMEDLQSQRSTSMDWLSKFTGAGLRSHCRAKINIPKTENHFCLFQPKTTFLWDLYIGMKSFSISLPGPNPADVTEINCASFDLDNRFQSSRCVAHDKTLSCSLHVVITVPSPVVPAQAQLIFLCFI